MSLVVLQLKYQSREGSVLACSGGHLRHDIDHGHLRAVGAQAARAGTDPAQRGVKRPKEGPWEQQEVRRPPQCRAWEEQKQAEASGMSGHAGGTAHGNQGSEPGSRPAPRHNRQPSYHLPLGLTGREGRKGKDTTMECHGQHGHQNLSHFTETPGLVVRGRWLL